MHRIKMIHCLSNILRYAYTLMEICLKNVNSAGRVRAGHWEFKNYRVNEDICPSGTNKLW